MMTYIVWDIDPIAFVFGGFEIRWYSVFWMVAVALSFFIGRQLARKKELTDDNVNSLFIYVFIGIFVGARLGHCLFYDWQYYGRHLVEIVIPFRETISGNWEYSGYAGLASHGGVVGLILSVWLFCRKYTISFLRVLDLIATVAPLSACFIRLANLMNSEIIGIETDVPWAFVFSKVDDVSRHPAQLYEAIYYAIIFVVAVALNRFSKIKSIDGFISGFVLTTIFLFRFMIEFIKENQVSFEDKLPLDMGQILSMPILLLGIYLMARHKTGFIN